MDDNDDEKVPCKYGEECYQKNPDHLNKYKHPQKRDLVEKDTQRPAKRSKYTDPTSSIELKNGSEDQLIIAKNLPSDVKEKIKLLFLVDMPNDFYSFYDFCKSLSSTTPKKALKPLNLELVGPFDVFEDTIKNCNQEEALRHYRYYFDPPEFQTVFKVEDKERLHYGYFRDNPNEEPCFVASNRAAVGPNINCVAGNLFGAVNVHAEQIKASADIFRKMKIQKLQSALVKWAKKNKFSLDTVTPEIKARRSKIVAKTFNNIGVVVPYDKKTDVGYRSLAVNDDELNKILKKITSANSDDERDIGWSKLQPVITAASIANDESDFGTSLELGLNMFAFGNAIFHKTIERVMCPTYSLLQRNQFADILKTHLKQRSKNSDLSTII